MTRLAVPIMVRSAADAHAAAVSAAGQGADMVEYRIDRFTDNSAAIQKLVSESPLPCIVTCRPTFEGGLNEQSDSERLTALQHAASANPAPAYIDVELATWQASQANQNLVRNFLSNQSNQQTGLILSSHDFQTRPADLIRRVSDMACIDLCRVIKIVWRARSLRDNLEAFEILAQRNKPTIALCMDEAGQPSRILAKKFGALLTFASLDSDSATAPGQVSLSQMKQLFNFDHHSKNTRVYGVVGYPVGHSMSPAIHNPAFKAIGFDGVYLPLLIPPEYEHFKATITTWLDFDSLDFGGVSVTIPHKHNLLRFVEESNGEIEPLALQIGAANTLHVRQDGSLYACNTDYAAALDAVCDSLAITRDQLAGRSVAVIGAGGAARAVVAGFAHYNCHVICYNRTIEKAQTLASDFASEPGPISAEPIEKLADARADIFINCTPIGMHPNTDETPIVSDAPTTRTWSADTVVFDTIYNPIETKLLKIARDNGCITVPGTEMFTRQGAAQFELWTGQPAPLDVFKKALLQQLNK